MAPCAQTPPRKLPTRARALPFPGEEECGHREVTATGSATLEILADQRAFFWRASQERGLPPASPDMAHLLLPVEVVHVGA